MTVKSVFTNEGNEDNGSSEVKKTDVDLKESNEEIAATENLIVEEDSRD